VSEDTVMLRRLWGKVVGAQGDAGEVGEEGGHGGLDVWGHHEGGLGHVGTALVCF
jgi:hypothetical protein